MLTELAGGDLSVIRSGMIRKALKAEDELVTGVLHRAAEVLGYACVTVRHLIDPEAIVLGGGVIEACSDFIMPIVENIVGSDRLPGAREGGRVLLSALGDDAVVLGAVALARKRVGRSPFKKRYRVGPTYPEIGRFSFGEIVVGRRPTIATSTSRSAARSKPATRASQTRGRRSRRRSGRRSWKRFAKAGPRCFSIGCAKAEEVALTSRPSAISANARSAARSCRPCSSWTSTTSRRPARRR